MKVKIYRLKHIKDFIRSLPPNVEAQGFWANGSETV